MFIGYNLGDMINWGDIYLCFCFFLLFSVSLQCVNLLSNVIRILMNHSIGNQINSLLVA